MIIQGTITEKATGLPLPWVNVFFSDQNGTITTGAAGTITDENGIYSLNGVGEYITASFVGLSPQTKKATPPRIDFDLIENNLLPEFEIKGIMIWPRVLIGLVVIAIVYLIYKKYAN